MAERVTRQVIDDLDGTDITDAGGETIEFAFRGVSYRRNSTSHNRPDSPAVRAWAANNGYSVSARGRIPSDVLGAFEDANKG